MIDVDTFFNIMSNICEELPDEFFNELHLGVLLDEGIKISPHAADNDLIILGEYHRSYYGNQIVIYYGSFMRICGYMNEEQITEKIREVVLHEFRHHLENLAGIHGRDSLEYEDAVQIHQYLRNKKSLNK